MITEYHKTPELVMASASSGEERLKVRENEWLGIVFTGHWTL
jgi:hypothetical protein